MIVTVQLDGKVIKEAEEAYRKVELPGSQRTIITAIAANLRDYIKINDTVMLGLVLMAANDWQRERGKQVSGVETIDPVEQVEFILGLLGLLRERLFGYLQDETNVVLLTRE
ncbi:MAG: hypothetical protein ACFFD4_12375 [Candidatus Odinarchaeota archaeon]